MFGYLDTGADTQFVRISRVGPDAAMSGELSDPPSVSTTNLLTGDSIDWTDSLVVLEDGALGRIFFATFDVQKSVTYRLDVRDGGTAPTRASTTVPAASGILPGTPYLNRFGDLEQPLIWQDLPHAREAHVHYRVRGHSTGIDTTVVVTYAGFGDASPRGWTINVTLERDYRLVRRFAANAVGDTSLVLLDFSMSIEAPSQEWTATDEASNIENGSGFFGSVARFKESWSLDSTLIRSLGYRTP